VTALVKRYGCARAELAPLTPGILSDTERAGVEETAAKLVAAGAPEKLARAVAILPPMTIGADLVDLAEASDWNLPEAARLYHEAGAFFAFDRLRAAVGLYRAGDHFERTAVRRLVEDLLAEQTALTKSIMDFAGGPQAGESAETARAAVASWAALRSEAAALPRRTVEEIEAAGGEWTFAKLTIANAALRELASAPAKGRRK